MPPAWRGGILRPLTWKDPQWLPVLNWQPCIASPLRHIYVTLTTPLQPSNPLSLLLPSSMLHQLPGNANCYPNLNVASTAFPPLCKQSPACALVEIRAAASAKSQKTNRLLQATCVAVSLRLCRSVSYLYLFAELLFISSCLFIFLLGGAAYFGFQCFVGDACWSLCRLDFLLGVSTPIRKRSSCPKSLHLLHLR